jgi:hypothetical protein
MNDPQTAWIEVFVIAGQIVAQVQLPSYPVSMMLTSAEARTLADQLWACADEIDFTRIPQSNCEGGDGMD